MDPFRPDNPGSSGPPRVTGFASSFSLNNRNPSPPPQQMIQYPLQATTTQNPGYNPYPGQNPDQNLVQYPGQNVIQYPGQQNLIQYPGQNQAQQQQQNVIHYPGQNPEQNLIQYPTQRHFREEVSSSSSNPYQSAAADRAFDISESYSVQTQSQFQTVSASQEGEGARKRSRSPSHDRRSSSGSQAVPPPPPSGEEMRASVKRLKLLSKELQERKKSVKVVFYSAEILEVGFHPQFLHFGAHCNFEEEREEVSFMRSILPTYFRSAFQSTPLSLDKLGLSYSDGKYASKYADMGRVCEEEEFLVDFLEFLQDCRSSNEEKLVLVSYAGSKARYDMSQKLLFQKIKEAKLADLFFKCVSHVGDVLDYGHNDGWGKQLRTKGGWGDELYKEGFPKVFKRVTGKECPITEGENLPCDVVASLMSMMFDSKSLGTLKGHCFNFCKNIKLLHEYANQVEPPRRYADMALLLRSWDVERQRIKFNQEFRFLNHDASAKEDRKREEEERAKHDKETKSRREARMKRHKDMDRKEKIKKDIIKDISRKDDAELERMAQQFIQENCMICKDPLTVEASCSACPSFPVVLVKSPLYKCQPAGFSVLKVNWPNGVKIPKFVKLTLHKLKTFRHSCVLDVMRDRYLIVGQSVNDAVGGEVVGRCQVVSDEVRRHVKSVNTCRHSYQLMLGQELELVRGEKKIALLEVKKNKGMDPEKLGLCNLFGHVQKLTKSSLSSFHGMQINDDFCMLSRPVYVTMSLTESFSVRTFAQGDSVATAQCCCNSQDLKMLGNFFKFEVDHVPKKLQKKRDREQARTLQNFALDYEEFVRDGGVGDGDEDERPPGTEEVELPSLEPNPPGEEKKAEPPGGAGKKVGSAEPPSGGGAVKIISSTVPPGWKASSKASSKPPGNVITISCLPEPPTGAAKKASSADDGASAEPSGGGAAKRMRSAEPPEVQEVESTAPPGVEDVDLIAELERMKSAEEIDLTNPPIVQEVDLTEPPGVGEVEKTTVPPGGEAVKQTDTPVGDKGAESDIEVVSEIPAEIEVVEPAKSPEKEEVDQQALEKRQVMEKHAARFMAHEMRMMRVTKEDQETHLPHKAQLHKATEMYEKARMRSALSPAEDDQPPLEVACSKCNFPENPHSLVNVCLKCPEFVVTTNRLLADNHGNSLGTIMVTPIMAAALRGRPLLMVRYKSPATKTITLKKVVLSKYIVLTKTEGMAYAGIATAGSCQIIYNVDKQVLSCHRTHSFTYLNTSNSKGKRQYSIRIWNKKANQVRNVCLTYDHYMTLKESRMEHTLVRFSSEGYMRYGNQVHLAVLLPKEREKDEREQFVLDQEVCTFVCVSQKMVVENIFREARAREDQERRRRQQEEEERIRKEEEKKRFDMDTLYEPGYMYPVSPLPSDEDLMMRHVGASSSGPDIDIIDLADGGRPACPSECRSSLTYRLCPTCPQYQIVVADDVPLKVGGTSIPVLCYVKGTADLLEDTPEHLMLFPILERARKISGKVQQVLKHGESVFVVLVVKFLGWKNMEKDIVMPKGTLIALGQRKEPEEGHGKAVKTVRVKTAEDITVEPQKKVEILIAPAEANIDDIACTLVLDRGLVHSSQLLCLQGQTKAKIFVKNVGSETVRLKANSIVGKAVNVDDPVPFGNFIQWYLSSHSARPPRLLTGREYATTLSSTVSISVISKKEATFAVKLEPSLPKELIPQGRCQVRRKLGAIPFTDINKPKGVGEIDNLLSEKPMITLSNLSDKVVHVTKNVVCGVYQLQELAWEDLVVKMVPLEGQLDNSLEPGRFGVLECQLDLKPVEGSRLVVMHYADEVVTGKEVARQRVPFQVLTKRAVFEPPVDRLRFLIENTSGEAIDTNRILYLGYAKVAVLRDKKKKYIKVKGSRNKSLFM